MSLVQKPTLKRFITAIVMPATILGLQLVFKKAFNKEIIIGVPLAALAIGQIFPFLIHDHIMKAKLVKISSSVKKKGNSLQMIDEIGLNDSFADINKIKDITVVAFIAILVLFVCACLGGSATDDHQNCNILGGIAVSLSSVYMLII